MNAKDPALNSAIDVKTSNSHELSLNYCRLSLSDNTLYFKDGQIKLEPKVIRVLHCLATVSGEVVIREQLITAVWKDQVVSDDAITRCISILRKHFKQHPELGLSIETIAKQGYRLNQITVTQETPPSLLSRHYRVVAISVALVTFLLLLLSQWLPVDQEKNWERSILLASEAKERYPNLSQSGHWLTYARSHQNGMAIYVKSLTDEGIQQLTTGEFYDHQPTFSPDQKRIAFARITATQQCEIWTVPLIGGPEKKLASCQPQGVYDMSWAADGQELLYIDRQHPMAPGRLNRLHLPTLTQQVINIQSGVGVDDLALSADGQQIAVTLSPLPGVEDIYLNSFPINAPWKRLSKEHTKVHGLAFAADNRSLFFTSNRRGPFFLWQTPLSKWEPKNIHSALPNGDEISINAQHTIALERWTENSEVVALAHDGTELNIIADKQMNWQAQQAPDNKATAFISDRSGTAELWLQKGSEYHQLTQFNGPWILSFDWSPDSREIAFSVAEAKGYSVYLYNLDTQRLTQPQPLKNAYAPFWHPVSGELYFGSTRSGDWQIWRWSPISQELQKVTQQGGKVVKISADGSLFYTKANQTGLWLQNQSQEQQVLQQLAVFDEANWAVTNTDIFWVKRDFQHGSLLIQHSRASNSEVKQLPLNNLLYFSGLKLSRDKQQIWYARITREDSDIDLLHSEMANAL
ncbi:winged helix-turn-helix domain-containing protein [Pleionea sp. CnH1-48]|uniref:winged helix-turn-helix domain-containing protein n=1 Tax=Pleionea sp. CnH1-48 TaxID=2954494 RepID=UPI002097F5B2|nr:winged helix-turn-helix domain-containing protein [Pleionea sp. CnH1-48]MCO7223859.1 winged helix-turn-helix domain-containing protein [Pleionea sp. CnH1-48]